VQSGPQALAFGAQQGLVQSAPQALAFCAQQGLVQSEPQALDFCALQGLVQFEPIEQFGLLFAQTVFPHLLLNVFFPQESTFPQACPDWPQADLY
jgi:hypothetical protein